MIDAAWMAARAARYSLFSAQFLLIYSVNLPTNPGGNRTSTDL